MTATARHQAQPTPVTDLAGEERAAALVAEVVPGRDLALTYQPIVDTHLGTVVGAEALVTWAHEGSHIPTEQLVELAEPLGVMRKVDAWVIGQACRDAAAWSRDAGRPWVSVNLSGPALCTRGVVTTVLNALDHSGLAPDLLMLEITEGWALPDEFAARAHARALAARGVRFAVDDFGTGHANFSWLRCLPISALKIDRTFIAGLAADGVDRMMVEQMIRLAHALEVTVVAEGVESATQRLILEALGCDLSQGWYFHPSLTLAQLAEAVAGTTSRSSEPLVSMDAIHAAARALRRKSPSRRI